MDLYLEGGGGGGGNANTGWLYMVEMILKVLVFGFHNYWRSTQNRFDFVITVTVGKEWLISLVASSSCWWFVIT